MTGSQTISFWKMTGSGNDFVVVDNRGQVLPDGDISTFTRAVCRRRHSVGADGVVLIEAPHHVPAGSDIAFRWRYINADGSEGDFCGNGAMCGARFALLSGIAPASHAFHTPAGRVCAVAALDSQRVQLALEPPGPVEPPQAALIGDRELTLHPIQVGVPHAVLYADRCDEDIARYFPSMGREIRHHHLFAPRGTNVDLISVLDRHTLRMRTYERGVEAETLACGSGAIASALIATADGRVRPPVDVITTGGPTLTVDFGWDPSTRRAMNLTLEGEAKVVAKGEISEEALKET